MKDSAVPDWVVEIEKTTESLAVERSAFVIPRGFLGAARTGINFRSVRHAIGEIRMARVLADLSRLPLEETTPETVRLALRLTQRAVDRVRAFHAAKATTDVQALAYVNFVKEVVSALVVSTKAATRCARSIEAAPADWWLDDPDMKRLEKWVGAKSNLLEVSECITRAAQSAAASASHSATSWVLEFNADSVAKSMLDAMDCHVLVSTGIESARRGFAADDHEYVAYEQESERIASRAWERQIADLLMLLQGGSIELMRSAWFVNSWSATPINFEELEGPGFYD